MDKHKGFTIVELLIVIVVIAVLASIAVVSYAFLRGDASDAKIRSAVKNIGDAISLHESQNLKKITGQGMLNAANGVDTLVPKYLKTDYRQGLTSKNSSDSNRIIIWHECRDGSGDFVVYASLNNPKPEEQQGANRLKSRCSHSDSFVPTSGDPAYNYAQLF